LHKKLNMKILKILIILIGVINHSNTCKAQEIGKFRTDILLGISNPDDVFGVALSIEPKLNLVRSVTAGLRIGTGIFLNDIEHSTGYVNIDAVRNDYIMGVCDYYFYRRSNIGISIGGGIGLVRFSEVKTRSEELESIAFSLNPKLGTTIRLGADSGKFRVGVEYNLTTDSEIKGLDGYDGILYNDPIIDHSYIAIKLGFFIGGGHWEF